MNNHINFIEKLTCLEDLYSKANGAIILLENFNVSQDAYIGPHNEQRNALNHIMRMVRQKDDSPSYEKEFDAAKAHLWRAGYDAYELICIDQIDYITRILGDKYSTTDVRIGLPDYFERIRPSVESIKTEIATIRSQKKNGKINGVDVFEAYFELADKLINYVKEITVRIPIIDACYTERITNEREQKTKSRRNFILGVVINVVVAALFFLLGRKM
jgi:hypothetical protein